jgi:hypothetical protein
MASPLRYSRHYTVDEARALLPQLAGWLDEIHQLSEQQEACRAWQEAMFEQGHDLGGDQVEGEIKNLNRLLQILNEFKSREILIKDLSQGLVDFPSMMGGREVFLCWEKGQQDIIYWHDLDAGYAGRHSI